jgi:hypothetical protein
MLKRTGKGHKSGDLLPHLCKESQIPLLDALTGVLLWISQDRFGLMHELIGVLQRRPEGRSRL